MLRSEVAPRLSELGFKGSGQSYMLADEDAWVLIGFQKFTRSTANEVDFTINVTVASKAVWSEMRRERKLPEKPSANTFYGTFAWQQRIATLMDADNDVTWSVRAGQPTEPVTEDVVRAIEMYGLPAIESKLTELRR
jgi:Domain of unknown function (DUF4304)